MSDEIMTDPTTCDDWRGKTCRCGVCGHVAKCMPREDFYWRLGEKFFRCEACVCTSAMPEGQS